MSIMNELLVKIVIASGGTVTNKDNRAQLLQDWLGAEIEKSDRTLFNGEFITFDGQPVYYTEA